MKLAVPIMPPELNDEYRWFMQSRMIKMIKSVFLFTLLWIGLFSANSFATTFQSPLPSDQAFIFSVNINSPRFATVEWRIAPGYYLYSKRVHITLDPNVPADIRIPQGELKYDVNLGRLEVFSGNVSVPVKLKNNETKIRLNVAYQGCSVEGFCYPPLQKTLLLNFSDGKVSQDNTPSLPSLLTDQNGIAALFGAQHFGVTLLVFAGLGLLLSFTPCVLPMIPIVTGIIVGHKRTTNAKKGFFLSSTYVLGSSMTYAMAGVAAALMGSSLQVWLQKPAVIGIASGLFVLLALSLFGCYELRLPNRLQNQVANWSNHQRRGTYAGVFLMGMMSTLIISPCVTAPLVGVLMYISQTGDVVLGGGALFAMGIGMGIPLVLLGMSAGRWLPKSGAWMDLVKKMFGVLMLGMAIWLASRIVPPGITLILTGLLLSGVSIFLILYLPRMIEWRKLSRGLGYAIGLSGMAVMFGANMPDMMNHWIGARQAYSSVSSFIVIRDMATLNKELSLAQVSRKPVILDFYADWCESCIVMDRKVFGADTVKQALNNYVLLRVDLTSNSADDQVMMKNFSVIAPPTVLFFNAKGSEMNGQRIVGEVNAKEFLGRLNRLTAQKP